MVALQNLQDENYSKLENLTGKQRMFVLEYIKCWNGEEAATNAGYSKKTARIIAYQNLNKPKIKEAIDLATERMLESEKAEIRAIVQRELKAIAAADVTQDVQIVEKSVQTPVYDESGEIVKYEDRVYQVVEHQATDKSPNRRAIKSIKQNEKGVIDVQYYDKTKALEILGKYAGLLNDRTQVDVNLNSPLVNIDMSNLTEDEAKAMFFDAMRGIDG